MLIILHYSLWFLITHYCSSLLIIIHHCSLLSRIIYYVYYHSLSFIIVHSWWFTIHHYSLLFTIIHYCSHYSQFIVHYSSSHAGHRTIPHFWNNQNMHRCLQRWPCVFWMCLEGIGGTWWDPWSCKRGVIPFEHAL